MTPTHFIQIVTISIFIACLIGLIIVAVKFRIQEWQEQKDADDMRAEANQQQTLRNMYSFDFYPENLKKNRPDTSAKCIESEALIKIYYIYYNI